MRLGFLKGLDDVGVVAAHRDLRYVNVAVANGFHGEIFSATGFAAGGEFGDGAARGGLGCLAAGVPINLCIEHQDVDVFAGAEDMVEAAEADVEGPAVAAENPNALADQVVGDGKQVTGVG